jgi:DNA-binding transcriptional LysR family regulator
VLSELRAAEEDITHAQGEPRGTLRVSTVGNGTGPIGDVLTAFLAKYPEISVDLHLSARRVDLLAENFDLAIRFGKLHEDAHLVAKRVGTSYRKMFASPGYLERHPAPEHPRDLHGHELLHPAGRRELELVSERGGRFRLHLSGRFCSNQITALRHQAIAGFGIANLPVSIASDDVRRGALRPVLPGWSSDPDPIHLVYPKQRFVPQKVRAFVEFAARALPPDAFGEKALRPADEPRTRAR